RDAALRATPRCRLRLRLVGGTRLWHVPDHGAFRRGTSCARERHTGRLDRLWRGDCSSCRRAALAAFATKRYRAQTRECPLVRQFGRVRRPGARLVLCGGRGCADHGGHAALAAVAGVSTELFEVAQSRSRDFRTPGYGGAGLLKPRRGPRLHAPRRDHGCALPPRDRRAWPGLACLTIT